MRVAVMGSTGVLGRALIPLLLEQGYIIRTMVRSLAKARDVLPPEVELAKGDLLAPDIEQQLPAFLEGCEAVLHIATAIPSNMSAPGAWDANNRLRTDGVRVLLNAALNAGARQYLQQSITMAYPDHGDEWITEDMPLDTTPARVAVNTSVIAMEDLVRTLATDRLRWCILRGGRFVGPDTFAENTVADLRSGTRVIAGTGQNFLSLIHVADMATAVVAALTDAPDRSIFNIVDEPLREGEYLDKLADAIGADRPPRNAALPTPPSWRCSNHAARSSLRWAPTHPIIPVQL